jgi:serine/threonine protein kinase
LVLRGRCSRLVLDFSKTRFIDSAGLGLLEIVRREAVPRGIPLAIAAMQANIRELFQITRLDRLFPIFDTVEAAMVSEIRQPGKSGGHLASEDFVISAMGSDILQPGKSRFVEEAPGIPYRRHQTIGGDREVLGVLNQGGMGILYLVDNHSAGQLRVLKTYRDECLGAGQVRREFLREAEMWAGLGQHDFIVRLFSVFEHDGRPYLEMEYIEPDFAGRVTLRDHLNDRQYILEDSGRLSLRRALEWGVQFCEGMEHAQRHGILGHRDIKPENLMMAPYRVQEGEVMVFSAHQKILKIADFGLAKSLDGFVSPEAGSDGVAGFDASLRLCATGTFCGTPPYMPPEQFERAEEADSRNDIYSFGIVLYEIVAGRLPFQPPRGLTTSDAIRAWHALHANQRPELLDTPLWPVIERCLAKRPQDRYQSFENLRREFHALQSSLTH